VIISKVWAMPNKWTFKVPPLIGIIQKYKFPGENWVDPFAGFNSPAEMTNDLNPDAPTQFHLEALEFLTMVHDSGQVVDGVIFDPPYSLTQVSKSYNDMGLQFKGKENPTGGFPKVKAMIAQLMRPGGYVISYGWNSVGMGKKRGFGQVEILLCCHGGNRNDTIVVVEERQ